MVTNGSLKAGIVLGFLTWISTISVSAGDAGAISDVAGQDNGVHLSAKIVYIRDTIPDVPFKPYCGKTYTDTIPDTLDIVE